MMLYKANYFLIQCCDAKNGKLLWQYESEAICPENKISKVEMVTRILQAMSLLQQGCIKLAHHSKQEAISIIKTKQKGN